MIRKRNKSFYIRFEKDHFKKFDLLNHDLIVLRVYPRNKWRRLLNWLGFSVKMNEIKVSKNVFTS